MADTFPHTPHDMLLLQCSLAVVGLQKTGRGASQAGDTKPCRQTEPELRHTSMIRIYSQPNLDYSLIERITHAINRSNRIPVRRHRFDLAANVSDMAVNCPVDDIGVAGKSQVKQLQS